MYIAKNLLVKIFLHPKHDYHKSKNLFDTDHPQALPFLFAWQLKNKTCQFIASSYSQYYIDKYDITLETDCIYLYLGNRFLYVKRQQPALELIIYLTLTKCWTQKATRKLNDPVHRSTSIYVVLKDYF